MKTIILEKSKDSEDCERHQLLMDGESIVSIHPLWDCPEDAIIGRGLLSGYDIIEFIKLGIELGKKGEDIQVVEKEVNELTF